MKQQPEVKVIGKVMDFVNGIYPKEIEKAIKKFNTFNISFPDKTSHSREFASWFLLRYLIESAFTPVELAYKFPLDYFTNEEKKIIKNFVHFNESVFLVKSRKGKEYLLQDVRDNRGYKIKTLDLDYPLKEGIHILATIIKSMKDHYFFYGNIIPYNKEEAEIMIKTAKNSPKNKPNIPEIEWEIKYKK